MPPDLNTALETAVLDRPNSETSRSVQAATLCGDRSRSKKRPPLETAASVRHSCLQPVDTEPDRAGPGPNVVESALYSREHPCASPRACAEWQPYPWCHGQTARAAALLPEEDTVTAANFIGTFLAENDGNSSVGVLADLGLT